MGETNESLLNLVNASGFLFQLRVEREVEQTKASHPWRVAAREHRWLDSTTHGEGFIDLVLETGILRMVVECKRVQDGNWLFLLPDDQYQPIQRTCIMWTDKKSGQEDLSGWSDLWIDPESSESAFCVVRGQNDKDRPMLERTCDGLLRSLESLAGEELGLHTHSSATRVYIPTIVTNAALRICRFSTNQIDLNNGQLPSADFETVPFIRFRKSLTTKLAYSKETYDLTELNVEQERTVFVVHAASLSHFLKEFNLLHPHFTGGYPWKVARVQQ